MVTLSKCFRAGISPPGLNLVQTVAIEDINLPPSICKSSSQITLDACHLRKMASEIPDNQRFQHQQSSNAAARPKKEKLFIQKLGKMNTCIRERIWIDLSRQSPTNCHSNTSATFPTQETSISPFKYPMIAKSTREN
jgi:hypothetical protein